MAIKEDILSRVNEPPLSSRAEIDLYRLLKRCEQRARSEPEADLQKDPKFHHVRYKTWP